MKIIGLLFVGAGGIFAINYLSSTDYRAAYGYLLGFLIATAQVYCDREYR